MFKQKQVKAEKLKVTRDYSFLLSDDAELPAPSKEPPSRNISVRSSGMLLLGCVVWCLIVGVSKYFSVIKETYTGFLLMFKWDKQLKLQEGVSNL